ncbi:MAG: tryptophan 7-halogenase [Pseudomonadota bacterium]|nr:tryptophan 7-halogenase [Pseudomonadota bacterium]
MQAMNNILIVGGGTAGWLTAAFLARTLGAGTPGGVRITLVESADIGIVGVGEGTFPSIRGTLAAIGIDEARFIHDCHATFKQGIRFTDWVRAPGTPGQRHYFHPFSQPSQRQGSAELLPYWLRGAAGAGVSFAAAATMQEQVAGAARGPKRYADGDYLGPMNYAYHFDAGRFATLLAEHGRALGVAHLFGTVERVELDDDGAIAAVHTREQGALRADLYIDCSGFRAALIGQAMGVPFKSLKDVLFVDRALAMQVPYPANDTPIPSLTISSAQEAGWIWDIGLQQRRGVGHVYASRYTDDARAEQVLRDYIGPASDALTPRLLKFEVGHRELHWVKNCVAVGLSGGFIEPLESSGIGLIETAAYLIGYLFPFNGDCAAVAPLFNQLMRERYARVVDFVKLHYCLSQRTDTRFWVDNTDPASIPATLRAKLAMWRARPPHRLDFITDLEMYPPSSWQYVLYGMEFATDLHPSATNEAGLAAARQEMRTIALMAQRAQADLPPHRALVEHFCRKATKSCLP